MVSSQKVPARSIEYLGSDGEMAPSIRECFSEDLQCQKCLQAAEAAGAARSSGAQVSALKAAQKGCGDASRNLPAHRRFLRANCRKPASTTSSL